MDFRGASGSGTGSLLLHGRDLSEGGAFLASDLLLEPGTRLELTFQLPGIDGPLTVAARVAWVRRFPEPDETPGMGVEFVAMVEAHRAQLAGFLAS